jgi:redox-sensitive bicupin YhaK (pirin superfamily)
MPSGVDVRLADTRFHTDIDWLDSWHSFSFGGHNDADNTHHGLLLVLNDDLIAGGGAFGTHPHRDMEIVTWVLDGTLEHRDSEGNHGIITRNIAQRMSAGTGIRH